MHATMSNRGRFTASMVRRGVKAAPQILVLMVQVRSLAAELPGGAGPEHGRITNTKVDGQAWMAAASEMTSTCLRWTNVLTHGW
jgi:hypothetical protein